jgi:hypothetical protein
VILSVCVARFWRNCGQDGYPQWCRSIPLSVNCPIVTQDKTKKPPGKKETKNVRRNKGRVSKIAALLFLFF